MRIPRAVVILLTGLVFAASAPSLTAQASSATGSHVCDDCHGSHDVGAGQSSLVGQGWSALAPTVTGLGGASQRCLQCHGTPGDRQQVDLGPRQAEAEGLFLGGSLFDDHPLGTERVTELGGDVLVGEVMDVESPGLTGLDFGPSVECSSCHDPHATDAVMRQDQAQDEICLSCHDAALDYNMHGLVSCGSCHKQHAAMETDAYLREPNANYLCGACHRGAATPLLPGIDVMYSYPLHTEPSDPDCKACHTIH